MNKQPASFSAKKMKDRLVDAYKSVLAKFSVSESQAVDYLQAYRQLALQLARAAPDKGSALLVSAMVSEDITQCSSLLSSSIAAVSRKPVLLVDLSRGDTGLAGMLGLTEAECSPADDDSRFFSVSGKWYIATREGVPVGPYKSVEAAESALAEFIGAPQWIKELKGKAWSPARFAIATQVQNLFFLAQAPARLALVRGTYLGDQDENIKTLLDGIFEQFGYVIFYGGPVLENALMLSVSVHVDEILLAAVENTTRVTDLEAARTTLLTYTATRISPLLVRASSNRGGAAKPDADDPE